MIDKDHYSYKTISEVVEILGLKSKKGNSVPYSHTTFLGKRI